MNGRIRRGLWAGLCVLGIGVSSAAAQPAVPANLEVPAGHSVFLVGHASGTQNYICLPSDRSVAAWRFLDQAEPDTPPASPTEFWAWAIAKWDISRIAKEPKPAPSLSC